MWHWLGVYPLLAGLESHVLLLVHVSKSALVELLWRLLVSQFLPPLVIALWVSIVILVIVLCFPLAVSVLLYWFLSPVTFTGLLIVVCLVRDPIS